MVTNGCKKFELPASIVTGIAKHNTEGNNEFPIPLLYNLWLWPRPLPLCPYKTFSKVGDYAIAEHCSGAD